MEKNHKSQRIVAKQNESMSRFGMHSEIMGEPLALVLSGFSLSYSFTYGVVHTWGDYWLKDWRQSSLLRFINLSRQFGNSSHSSAARVKVSDLNDSKRAFHFWRGWMCPQL